MDARSASMGGASVSMISFENPSAYSLSTRNYLSIHYANPFGVKELSTVASSLFLANRIIDGGLILSCFGFEKYHETKISTQFSKKLSSHFALGVRLNYLSLLMSQEEGRKSMVSSDIGFLISPLPKWFVGGMLKNFLSSGYSTNRGEFNLPLTLKIGVNYELNNDFVLVGELEKDEINSPLTKLGCEYTPMKEFAVRLGIINDPLRPTFGVGYSPKNFSFDIASVYHTVLGFHTQFSMQYKF